MTKEEGIKLLESTKVKHGLKSKEYNIEYIKFKKEWGKPGRGLDIDLDRTNGGGGSDDSGHIGQKDE